MKKLLSVLAIMVLGSLSVFAQSVDHVPATTVSGLSVFQGQYINIIFATNESSTLSFTENSLKLSSIAFQTQLPIGADNINLPAFDLDRSPFKLAYNVIILAVSTEPNFTWMNSDKTFPMNGGKSFNHFINYVKIFDRRTLMLTNDLLLLRLF